MGMPDCVTEQEVINDLKERGEEVGIPKNSEIWVELEKMVEDPTRRQRFYGKALDLRGMFIDLRTVYKLDELKLVKHGFICEGSGHIDGTLSLNKCDIIKGGLKVLGYTQVKTIGIPVQDTFHKLDDGLSYDDLCKHVVGHTLDLRKTFTQIFAEQQPLVKPVSFWVRHKASLVTGVTTAIVVASIAAWRYWCK
jgi:hypothetical protein